MNPHPLWHFAAAYGGIAVIAIFVILWWNRRSKKRDVSKEKLDTVNSINPIIPDQDMTDGATIGLQNGKSIGCSAIGKIRSLTLERFIIGTTFKFSCVCVVDFFWLKEGAKSSPSELRLMSNGTNSPYQLAILKTKESLACPCQVNYEGTGDWKILMQAVADTMVISQDRRNHPPWEAAQPVESLFCSVAIEIPDGVVGQLHRESQARIDFELNPQGYDVFTVKIIVPPKTAEESARFFREAAKQL